MKRQLRHAALTCLKGSGVFARMKDSAWRRQRLLILCYHGISIDDEHHWDSTLFMRPEQFDLRLRTLADGKYTVLPLGEALERLYRKDLPPRSVALTFDDGGYDFYRQAWPQLKQHGFPVTVYLTTYYSEFQRPAPLIASYMLWKARDAGPVDLTEFGISQPVSLASAHSRQAVMKHLSEQLSRQDLNGEQKDQIAAILAGRLGIDYQRLCEKRLLSLMNRDEVKQLAAEGVDFQLHTHRHRTPENEELFRREIRDNRLWIANVAGGERRHFCYPSGCYRPEFLKWLAADNIISATTCDTGLATSENNPLLLPRLVDTCARTDLEFESWLTGVGHFLSRRQRGRHAYVPE
jgi:peptidoglycan/xylan/chitin deacetylase (PgdA/CDA1 family)